MMDLYIFGFLLIEINVFGFHVSGPIPTLNKHVKMLHQYLEDSKAMPQKVVY